MMRRTVFVVLLGTTIAGTILVAQRPPLTPLAITGSPSSGRHCVSGQTANVHSLGWMQSGRAYRITFDADIPLVTTTARVDLEGRRMGSAHGTPDLHFTASSSGTMALFVSGNGRAGCYSYKTEMDRATTAAQEAPPIVLPAAVVPKPAKNRIRMMAIAGQASSAKHCISGDWVAKVHPLGRIDQGASVTVTFDSDFDAMAALVVADPAAQRAIWYVDDDSGGDLDPKINTVVSQAGTLALLVGGESGSAGCYHYKVEMSAGSGPPPSPSPSPSSSPSLSPTPSPAPGGRRTFKAAWVHASWVGGRTGTPLSSRGIDPVPSTVIGRMCPVNALTLENHPTRYPAYLDLITDEPRPLLVGRINCSLTPLRAAMCRTAGSGGGASDVPICATDPVQTPLSNVKLVDILSTPGVPPILASQTPRNFDVNILWCSDRADLNVMQGTRFVRGVAPLDCVEN